MPIVVGFAVYAAVVVFSWRGFCVCGGSFCAFLLLFSSKLGSLRINNLASSTQYMALNLSTVIFHNIW